MEKIKSISETLKSFFELLKTALIPILFGVILVYPAHIKTILKESGINKISGMGVEINVNELEKDQNKTAEVANNIQKSQQKIDSMALKLKSIALTSKDTIVIKKVQDLQKEITGIKSDFKKVDSSLKKTMITQEQTLEDLTGKTVDNFSGWIFIGKATKRGGEWDKKGRLTIDKIPISSLENGNQTVNIIDDVYLRSGSLDVTGFYSNLPVKKALKKGTTVTSKKVGYTNSIGGGVFVWIYINE